MKNKIFYLQSILAVVFCVIFSMTLISCSDDDDDVAATDEMSTILIGTWSVQDPNSSESEIIKINSYKNGIFSGAYDYEDDPYAFTMESKDGYYKMIEGGNHVWNFRVTSVTYNQIVWRIYDAEQYSDPDYSGMYYEKDEFGYYYTEKWVRVI